MSTATMQKPDVGADDWVAAFFQDADLMDIDRLGAWFADNIDLRFGNNPTITDKDTAVDVMGRFYQTVAGMKHTREAIVGEGANRAQQAIVTYSTMDGRDVSIPVSTYLRRTEAGLIDRLWIYIDMTPLYAPPIAS